MALKRKLTKEAYEKLAKELQAEYKEVEGDYILDVESSEIESNHPKMLEDFGNLNRAKDRETQASKELREKLKAIEDQKNDDNDNNYRKKGDIEALEKSWNSKLEAQTLESSEKLSKKDKIINKLLINDKAQEIANEISTSPNIIMPHIKQRLTVESVGDDAKTRVLDKDGNLSATTISELKEEFKANADYSAIIKATQGSGGGAAGGSNQSGSTGKSLKDMNATEEAKFANENPEEHKRMVEADPARAALL